MFWALKLAGAMLLASCLASPPGPDQNRSNIPPPALSTKQNRPKMSGRKILGRPLPLGGPAMRALHRVSRLERDSRPALHNRMAAGFGGRSGRRGSKLIDSL